MKYFCENLLILMNPRFSVPDEISKIAPKHRHFCWATESEENGSSSCCHVYPGRSNISRPLFSLRI